MKVIVMHGSRRYEVSIPGSATVSELKDKLKLLSGVAAERQDLQMMGDSLCDEASLSEQGVQDRDRLQLVATGGEPLSEPPPPAQPSARRDAVPEAEPPRRAREPPPPARDEEARELDELHQMLGKAKPASSSRSGGASSSKARSPVAARPGASGSNGAAAAPPAAAPGGGAGDGGPLGSALRSLDAIGGQLDELEGQVRARQPPHQELFTRVLEKLDGLDLDSLTDEQRGEVRPVRKGLVRRCEAISAEALRVEREPPSRPLGEKVVPSRRR